MHFIEKEPFFPPASGVIFAAWPYTYLKGASENRRLFDRKIRLLELDDFGDSNANWNANGRKKCAVSET